LDAIRKLKQVGVSLIDPSTFALQCECCGLIWWPKLLPGGGRLPRGYWKCPHGCNVHPK
jgi:hypothetical protein